MNRLSILSAVTVLAAAGLSLRPSPDPAPVPGPGAVMDAVRDLLKAVDEGDRNYLERAFADVRHQDRYAFDEKGSLVQVPGKVGELCFQDVGADGGVLARTDRKGAIDALLGAIGGKDVGLRTTVKSIAADCPAAECSWASVEIERSFRRGEGTVTVPMRATVLVRYHDEQPTMRIFAWHCSPAPKPAGAAPAK